MTMENELTIKLNEIRRLHEVANKKTNQLQYDLTELLMYVDSQKEIYQNSAARVGFTNINAFILRIKEKYTL